MGTVRLWRGASYKCWNDDFWLETRAIFSTYRTRRILPNGIRTLAVMIHVGTSVGHPVADQHAWSTLMVVWRAVWPVPEYLLWSASRLSRRVASHLAALTALRQDAAAWWTLVEREVANPKGRQVNWYTCLLTTKRRYLRTAWCIGTWR